MIALLEPLERTLGRVRRRAFNLTNLWSITIEGEIVWWAADDIHLRKRKLNMEVRPPKWLWRPFCLLRGRHEQYYRECVYCGKSMKGPR